MDARNNIPVLMFVPLETFTNTSSFINGTVNDCLVFDPTCHVTPIPIQTYTQILESSPLRSCDLSSGVNWVPPTALYCSRFIYG